MRYLLVLLGLLVSGTAEAIDCQTPPTCESLGYAKADDLGCETDGYLNCPFDTSYKKCVTHNCEKLGFTKDDKTLWCSNIIKCNADTTYTLCECMKSRCEIGDVFYADGSCGKVEAYVKDSSPRPVGVVYSLTCSGHGKVISLRNLKGKDGAVYFNPKNPYGGHDYMLYGFANEDIPNLTNYNSEEQMMALLKKHEPDLYDGKGNTAKILAYEKTDCTYAPKDYDTTEKYGKYCIAPAAEATHQYYPPEIDPENPFAGAGKWYLPAIGEFVELYGCDYENITAGRGTSCANATTKKIVNATLTALKAKGVNAEKLMEGYHWSSTEFDATRTWDFGLGDGEKGHGERTYDLKVNGSRIRPSLEFY